MTYALQIDEEGCLTLPQAVCEHLGLAARAQVEVEEDGNTLRVTPVAHAKAHKELGARTTEDTERYVGLLRQEFLAEGWSSVDDYVADMRSR